MHNTTVPEGGLHIHDFRAGKFQSANGNIIDLRTPLRGTLGIADIAIGLSNICRFGGQTKNFYSVAQHSVFVMHLAPPELKKIALMHDAAEAYIGDVIKPLKHLLGETYHRIEENFLMEIFELFGMDIYHLEDVKPYDLAALELEHEALQKENPVPLMVSMNKHGMPEPTMHFCWDILTARCIFLEEYRKLWK